MGHRTFAPREGWILRPATTEVVRSVMHLHSDGIDLPNGSVPTNKLRDIKKILTHCKGE
jgi:hypothetical protein